MSWARVDSFHSLAKFHRKQGIYWILVFSCNSQPHFDKKKCGFGLFADSFFKTVFAAWVEQELTHFTRWPNFQEKNGYPLDFSVSVSVHQVKCNLIHTNCVEVFYVRICPIFSWFSRTNAIPFVFKACDLRPVFEKAKFDVAGKVIFRRIWNTVSRSKNAIFHRSALSHFLFKLFYGQS